MRSSLKFLSKISNSNYPFTCKGGPPNRILNCFTLNIIYLPTSNSEYIISLFDIWKMLKCNKIQFQVTGKKYQNDTDYSDNCVGCLFSLSCYLYEMQAYCVGKIQFFNCQSEQYTLHQRVWMFQNTLFMKVCSIIWTYCTNTWETAIPYRTYSLKCVDSDGCLTV